MPESQARCVKEHARSAVAHDAADFFTALGTVAVRRADAAEGFAFHMRAVRDALRSVFLQFCALRAEFFPGRMFSAAVYGDYFAHGFKFPGAFFTDSRRIGHRKNSFLVCNRLIV